MFRPEMLRPMGLPEGVQAIAGGLSLERPTMIKCVRSVASPLSLSLLQPPRATAAVCFVWPAVRAFFAFDMFERGTVCLCVC